MPGYGGTLTNEELSDLVIFLQTRKLKLKEKGN